MQLRGPVWRARVCASRSAWWWGQGGCSTVVYVLGGWGYDGSQGVERAMVYGYGG